MLFIVDLLKQTLGLRPADKQLGPGANRLTGCQTQAETMTAVRKQVRLYRDALRNQGRAKLDEFPTGTLASSSACTRKQGANYRDGAMAVLIGIAARHSIDEDRAIRIDELTDFEPQKD